MKEEADEFDDDGVLQKEKSKKKPSVEKRAEMNKQERQDRPDKPEKRIYEVVDDDDLD